MITTQALDIVLEMARETYAASGGILSRQLETEAIKEVESLLKSYEDNDYKDEDYMED